MDDACSDASAAAAAALNVSMYLSAYKFQSTKKCALVAHTKSN